MPGTKAGGKKAAKTNKARYGDDFYENIGAAGGKTSRGGGFAANRELAAIAGRKGGLKSRRTAASYLAARRDEVKVHVEKPVATKAPRHYVPPQWLRRIIGKDK